MAKEEKGKLAITATYDKDTKRKHRYNIDEGQVISGSLYVDKNTDIPKSITLKLGTEKEAEE